MPEQRQLLITSRRAMLNPHVVEKQVENLAPLQRNAADAHNRILAADGAQRMSDRRRFAGAHRSRHGNDCNGAGQGLLDPGQYLRRLRADEYVCARNIAAKQASLEVEVLFVHRSSVRFGFAAVHNPQSQRAVWGELAPISRVYVTKRRSGAAWGLWSGQ